MDINVGETPRGAKPVRVMHMRSQDTWRRETQRSNETNAIIGGPMLKSQGK